MLLYNTAIKTDLHRQEAEKQAEKQAEKKAGRRYTPIREVCNTEELRVTALEVWVLTEESLFGLPGLQAV